MIPNPGPNPATPQRALLTVRVLWFALLGGQMMFLIVVSMLISRGLVQPVPDEAARLFFGISWAMVLLGIPFGYFLRNQSYKKYWQADVITPQGYLVGNLMLWAICEGCSLATLCFCLLEGTLWPAILPSLLALSVQLYNYPDGKAMFPPGVKPTTETQEE